MLSFFKTAYTKTARAAALRAPVVGLLLAASLEAGCAADRPEVDAPASIADALELSGAVVFREEGDPVDQPYAGGDTLSWADAVSRAVETSPELQAALARVRAAEAEADLAGLLPNPILSVVLRFPEAGGKASVEAGLAADLLALLQRPRRSSAASQRLEATAAEALSTALDVVAGVEERYADVQALEELIPVLARRASVLDRLREVGEVRLELGEGTRHEVTALDAERTELAVEVGERRSELRVARLALARAIGEPSGAAAWTLEPWSPPAAVAMGEEAWIDAALARRPEVLALEWELGARVDEEHLARGDAFTGAEASVEAERDGEWSVGPGLAVPLPLFDTGSARERRARALTSEQSHRLTEARRGVVEDVRSALANLAGAQENLERVVRDLIPLLERRHAETDEAYRLGHVDVTALLFAERALQQSEARRVELARAMSLAHTSLQRSVGGPSVLRSVASEPLGDPDRDG